MSISLKTIIEAFESSRVKAAPSLKEAFENVRAKKGVVPFRKSDLTAPHIDAVLQQIAKHTGIAVADLHKEVDKWLKDKEIIELSKKSPILYETIAQNAIESAVFDLIEKHKVDVKSAPKVTVHMFNKLYENIMFDHKQFFPLHNWHDEKVLYSPVPIFLPDAEKEKKDPSLSKIKTAAAYPDGRFAFYIPFMQKLLDYAHLINIKPKGDKYKSNGGEIPDEWCYIEFLIIHEFMHYTYGDFHYMNKLQADPDIINWVGDFRSNYLLAKSGYTQLPMGLFSDSVNYDRQESYKEMYKVVKDEFDKLTPPWQKKLKELLKQLGDDHVEGIGEPGEGEDGEPGKDGKPGKGSGKPSDKEIDDIFDKIDKAHAQVEKKLKKAVENKEAPPKPDKNAVSDVNKKDRSAHTATQSTMTEFDWEKVKPTFNWMSLLANFTKRANASEDTYAKPDKSMATSVHAASQMGAAVVRPGEIETEAILKLAVCIDSSGSMTEIRGRIYSELHKLLKLPTVTGSMMLVKYSDSYKGFLCDIKRNSYGEVDDIKKISGVQRKGNIEHLFKQNYGGGTQFSSELVTDLLALHSKGFAIIVLTDSDILWDENYRQLSRLLKNAVGDMGMIFDRKESFIAFAKQHKSVSKNVTYFS